jgi:hypothetical protein
MEKVPGNAVPQVESRIGQTRVGYAEGVGQTLEEVRLEKAQVLPAEIAPLATAQLMNLIGVTRSTDHLRLNVPEAANPFQSSPTGPKHDLFLLQNVVRRSTSDVSKQLVNQLQRPPRGLSEQAVSFMRASLAREHNMTQLLTGLTTSMGQIHNRIVGSQEG